MHTKDLIKMHSVELFAQLGYEGTSISQIVKKVGIKKSSFYSHYENKESLLNDVLETMTEDYIHYIENSLNEREGDNVETTLYRCFFKYIEDNTDENDPSNKIYNQITQYPPVESKEKIYSMLKYCSDKVDLLFIELIREGQSTGEISNDLQAEDIISSYFSLIEGLSLSSKLFEESQHQLRGVWSIFWRGIRS